MCVCGRTRRHGTAAVVVAVDGGDVDDVVIVSSFLERKSILIESRTNVQSDSPPDQKMSTRTSAPERKR